MTASLTPTATCDWQLGERAAIEGKAPYPTQAGTKDPAYSAGYHLAYKTIHGKAWSLPPPKLSDTAILLCTQLNAGFTQINHESVSRSMHKILSDIAEKVGISANVILRVQVDLWFPQHCPCFIGGSVLVQLASLDHRNPRDIELKVNHLAGEYDLRPQIEQNLLPAMREVDGVLRAQKKERERRRTVSSELSKAISRAFGCDVFASFAEEGPKDIGSVYIHGPANTHVARLLTWLNTQG